MEFHKTVNEVIENYKAIYGDKFTTRAIHDIMSFMSEEQVEQLKANLEAEVDRLVAAAELQDEGGC